MSWEEFEEECFCYFCKEYGEYSQFQHTGGPNSNVPDIRAIPYHGGKFYIEVKEKEAQCGQFVLIPNAESRTFLYSKENKERPNIHSRRIIKCMNEFFDDYANAGTAGEVINLGSEGQDVFGNWIVNKYAEQGVRLIITEDFLIFPLERFKNYFTISATYRAKRSGSSHVAKSRIEIVRSYLSHKFGVSSFVVEGKEGLYFKSVPNTICKRFTIGGREYLLPDRDGLCEVRQLSNTYNSNVIFSISLKPDHPGGLSFEEVASYFLQ